MYHFKSLSRLKSTQDEKVRFIKGNVLKITQVELLPFFTFKSVRAELSMHLILIGNLISTFILHNILPNVLLNR